ncbi:hypothetical protein [Pseudomonas sp. ZS1P83]
MEIHAEPSGNVESGPTLTLRVKRLTPGDEVYFNRTQPRRRKELPPVGSAYRTIFSKFCEVPNPTALIVCSEDLTDECDRLF